MTCSRKNSPSGEPRTGVPEKTCDELTPHRLGLKALSRGGQLVIAAARAWSSPQAMPLTPCQILGAAGVRPSVFAAFAGLLALLATVRPDAPLFLAPGDDQIAPLEHDLLAALDALQQGEPWRSQRILASWLPPAAAPRAIALMAVAAKGFAAAGLGIAPTGLATVH